MARMAWLGWCDSDDDSDGVTRTVSSRCWSRLSLRGCGPLGGGERARATAADADSGDAEARETLQGGGERARVGVVQGPVNRRVAGRRHAAIGRDWPCCKNVGRVSLYDRSPCNSLLNRWQLFAQSLATSHFIACDFSLNHLQLFHSIACSFSPNHLPIFTPLLANPRPIVGRPCIHATARERPTRLLLTSPGHGRSRPPQQYWCSL